VPDAEVAASTSSAERRRAAGAPAAAPSTSSAAIADGDLRARMMRHEAEVIVEVLRSCGWNQTEAARKLDVPLRTLVHKIKAHGIKKLGFGVPK